MCRIVKLKGIYLVFSQYGWYFFNMAGIFMIWLVFTPYALGNASGLLDFFKEKRVYKSIKTVLQV